MDNRYRGGNATTLPIVALSGHRRESTPSPPEISVPNRNCDYSVKSGKFTGKKTEESYTRFFGFWTIKNGSRNWPPLCRERTRTF